MIGTIFKIIANPIFQIILILIGILLVLYTTKIVGFFGEYWVKKELRKLPKNKYKILNDILISVNDKTTQIDHIVFSDYGIFIIETKQYNGYITGSKWDKKWIRHFKKGKNIFYENPIRQNYGHVKAICELLSLDESKVFNIVCIPSMAKLKISHDGELTTNINIINKILSYDKTIIDNIDDYYKMILDKNIISKEMRKKHIKNIKENIKFNEETCPKCGGKLVERNGKYGDFIGCSNYPRCNYTNKK